MSGFALTPQEAANVRAATRFLRTRMGGWKGLAKALKVATSTAKLAPTPMLAFRLARLVGVGVDDVLAGRFPPPGTCPCCGHTETEQASPSNPTATVRAT